MTTEQPRVDVLDPEFYRDPNAAIAWLHKQAPVYWFDARPQYPRPMWIISRWEDCRAILSDPATFCSSRGKTLDFVTVSGSGTDSATMQRDERIEIASRMPGLIDPPDHTRHRLLVRDHFRPRRMHDLEAPVRQIVNDSLDLVDGQVADFVTAVGDRIPLYLTIDLMGLDRAMADDFVRWSNAIFASFEPDKETDTQTLLDMLDFFEEEVEDRRSNPRDDLITDLVQAEHEGDRFTMDEILMWCWVLLTSGQETTANLLSGGTLVLFQNPASRNRLADDPSLMSRAVAEMLRWVTPTRYGMRTATRSVDLGGQTIQEDDLVFLSYTSANRDPSAFADPFVFDVAREDTREHLSFAFGPHYCLGAPLARLEGQILFEEMLRRFPQYEVVDEPVWKVSTHSNRLESLMVHFA